MVKIESDLNNESPFRRLSEYMAKRGTKGVEESIIAFAVVGGLLGWVITNKGEGAIIGAIIGGIVGAVLGE